MLSKRLPDWAVLPCILTGILVSGCSSAGRETAVPTHPDVAATAQPEAASPETASPETASPSSLDERAASLAEHSTVAQSTAEQSEESPPASMTHTNRPASGDRGATEGALTRTSLEQPPDAKTDAAPSEQPADSQVRANVKRRRSSPVIRLDGRQPSQPALEPAAATPQPIEQTAGVFPARDAELPNPTAGEPTAAEPSRSALPPPAPRAFPVPLQGSQPAPEMQLDAAGQLISLSVREAPLTHVLSLIAEQQGLNIVTGSDLNLPISVTLHDVTVDQALSSILRIAGCAWHRESDIIYVSSIHAESHIDPNVQGREVRVFALDYVSATDVEKVVQGLLSPVGNIFSAEADSKNKRKTGETIVVEDLPAYVQRVEQYIAQIDQPPRQVLIEAHILEVQLSDTMTHGVNFDYLAEIANTDLRLETTGFANPLATTGMLFSVDGSDLTSLVEALQTTNDAKTLASPKVLVLNGQEARIQIGERLGYFVTTTTQTSTLQQVQFLDVGIVLRVTPQITASGQVIMTVSPEISSGEINDATGLPDKSTTEVETAVILNDGRGIIIGGLIQEADTDKQSKVPFIGDLWAVGRAFQRRVGVRDRSEIIVALVPRIVPDSGAICPEEESELYRATTPLLDPNLKRYPRPGEGTLPDAMRDPRRIAIDRMPDAVRNLKDDYPLPPEYYLPANSEHGEYVPNERYDPQQVPVYPPPAAYAPVAPYEEVSDAE